MPTAHMRRRAAELRRAPTPSERKLCEHVRDRRLCGVKIRRQHVLGQFVVDFSVPSRELIIEVDGAVHDGRRELDAVRERELRGMGYRIVRVGADDVLHSLLRVLEIIRRNLD